MVGENLPETKKTITLNVNGKEVNAPVKPHMTLAEFLREELDLTGTKVGCNRGECPIGGRGIRKESFDHRGPGRGRQTSSPAGGLCRSGCPAVRVLYARDGAVLESPLGPNPPPGRRGDPEGHRWQPLPMRLLSQYHPGRFKRF
jgi:hypothetical protein